MRRQQPSALPTRGRLIIFVQRAARPHSINSRRRLWIGKKATTARGVAVRNGMREKMALVAAAREISEDAEKPAGSLWPLKFQLGTVPRPRWACRPCRQKRGDKK